MHDLSLGEPSTSKIKIMTTSEMGERDSICSFVLSITIAASHTDQYLDCGVETHSV